ncbi:uncharacterized protein LOC128956871 [Oppia nitens]|uniref:uncharacterized protein LOC128956871 n=1 Tax=Oppia nitens TaxID=1686743 RepID=UPI0023DC710F|nr:uncharacterized protein LOC128956871 [Oppia nitens]
MSTLRTDRRLLSTHLSEDKTQTTTTVGNNNNKKITIRDIRKKCRQRLPISMVTAYDYCSAKQVDRAGIDIVLVGDSLGMVMLGQSGTADVTMDQMVHHCRAVRQGSRRSFIVADMPFGSYEISQSRALANAIRLVKEGGAEAVKLEGVGGHRQLMTIRAIIGAGIPVMGHIGLTPQSSGQFGGFRVQGRLASQALGIVDDALALQEAGCFAVVIEMVPQVVGTEIARLLRIPTIGIGAGNGTDGQVLVYHDMLGMYADFVPKFCRQYARLSSTIHEALVQYRSEVESRQFPVAADHTFAMKDTEEMDKFLTGVAAKCSHHSSDSTGSTCSSSSASVLRVTDDNKSINHAISGTVSDSSNSSVNDTLALVADRTVISSSAMNDNNSCDNSNDRQYLINNVKVGDEQQRRGPKVVVIGGGAMGSLFSAKLAAQGSSDVWMVSSWREHVEAINRDGLKLYNIHDQRETVRSVRATLDGMEVLSDGRQPDVCLVLVKSHSTEKASETASTLVGHNPQAIVVTLQNGVGNREQISATLDKCGYSNRVCQGVTNNGAFMLGPGAVRHTGSGLTYLASSAVAAPGGADDDNNNNELSFGEFASLLTTAGIDSQLSTDEDSLVWSKVVVNAAINPLTALMGVTNGYLLRHDYPRRMMRRLIAEGMHVCRAKGVQLVYGDDLDQAYDYVAQVVERTSGNLSSMLRDVLRGQPTEIQAINGQIVKEGERLDVSVEYNKQVMDMLLTGQFINV